jgi:hypothetical protein
VSRKVVEDDLLGLSSRGMGAIAKRTTSSVMLLLVLGVSTAATGAWAAAVAESTPQSVKLVGPDTLTVHLKAANNAFTATFNLSVENDGPLIAAPTLSGGGGYKFSVVSDRNYSKATDAPTIKINQAVPLEPTTITYVPVTLAVHDSDTTSLTVILTVISPSGVAPSTKDITLTRSPLSANFLGILIVSLGLGAFILGVSFLFQKKPDGTTDKQIIYTNSTFSFSQSWATSIAAILTVVGTVFTTTGVLTSLVPGIDTGFFLALTIVYGVVLALAPLVYSALQKPEDGQVYGTHLGYVIAAAITGVAVGGQLSTVGAVVLLSDLGWVRWLLVAVLGVIALLVIWYTEATRQQLWVLPKPPKDPTTNLPPPATAMAALP